MKAILFFWMLIVSLVIIYPRQVCADCREPGRSTIQDYYQRIHSLEKNIETLNALNNKPRYPTVSEEEFQRHINSRNKEIREKEKTIETYRHRIQHFQEKYCR